MTAWVVRWELCRDAEECVYELPLRYTIDLREPADLLFTEIVRHAPSTERKPRLAVIRFFMKRWSCSMMLFMYGDVRQRLWRPSSPDCFNSATALAYAGWPSTLITRGGAAGAG